MQHGPKPDITAAPTYLALAAEQKIIVQGDCRIESPAPPPSLVDHYGVWAQMLAPVVLDGKLAGTISVHQQHRTRQWTEEDVAALRQAQSEVTRWRADRSPEPNPL